MPESAYQVTQWYDAHRATFRLTGEINAASIFALCDEIDLAIRYYCFRNILIQLDSPGGEIKSLYYYLTKLREWKQKKASISTQGMTSVCSAAAIILSMGDISRRSIYPITYLLYHQASIPFSGSLTINDAKAIAVRNEETTRKLVKTLAGHIWEHQPASRTEFQDVSKLEDEYWSLFSQDNGEGIPLSHEDAKKLWLIDDVVGVNGKPSATNSHSERRP